MREPSLLKWPGAGPWAYLIIFTAHGVRLHGDENGSVDRSHNAWKTPLLEPTLRRARFESGLSQSGRAVLNALQREHVLRSIRKHTHHRRWNLHAVHVRSNHVHLVIESDDTPETILARVKAYATRALNTLDPPRRRRWAHHGSTRYLWDSREVAAAVQYFTQQQGAPMAVYLNPNRWPTR